MIKTQMTKEELLTTCLGLGRLPKAPGTWGSLPPVVVFVVLAYLLPGANPLAQGVLFFAGVYSCVQYGPRMIALTGRTDPQQVVADELAGQAIVMVVLSLLGPGAVWLAAAAGFALFRLFDITKPWPCKRLEKLPEGWGILADDLMAGLYAAAVLAAAVRLLPGIFG